MSLWAVIASGESVTPEVVAKLRDVSCIAVNNSYVLVPWARALVANDGIWWSHHPEAKSFPGDKWCGSEQRDLKWMRRGERGLGSGTNSGLRALDRAVFTYGAKRVLLLGVDLKGKHFHGEHPKPLKNPDEARFALFRDQFRKWKQMLPKDVEVLNCSPISTLDCFPRVTLDEALCVPA